MNLINEENCTATALTIEARFSNCGPQILYAGKHCREGDESGVGSLCQQPRQGGLAGSRRTPQNQRWQHAATFYQSPQHSALAHQMILPDKLAQGAGTHTIG